MADEHDDDEFKSLRAVWLEMRDEDPPQRGLDALMAAAHSQAKMLAVAAKPPWWKVLVRPPVLAFATVALLVGGVVIVIRHDDKKLSVDIPTHDSVNAPTPPTTQHVEPPPPAPPKATTTAPVHTHMSTGASRGEAVTEDAIAPRANTLIDQLEHQVEGAVTRGDCETAKAIAARIAKQDQTFYGEHTAAAIKTCL
ncbi:MAG: hypothetical protein QM831_19250 [Kofleriaceae bacterium]